MDPRLVQIVELRFFGGLTIACTAEVMGLSPRTVKYDWEMARAWLYRRLTGAPLSCPKDGVD
jgi:DNA-directed RNA polymerase specialized sigma24 family protein